MIAALFLAWAELARVRWEAAPARAGVGEPIVVSLVVEHPEGARASLPQEWLDAELSWALVAPGRLDATSTPQATRWRVELASLEPGERELPQGPVQVELAGGTKAELEQVPTMVAFAGELLEGEDAPRAPRDFRPAAPEDAGWSWPWVAAGGALLVAVGALAGWLLRGRRRESEAPPSVAARIAALGQRNLDDAQVVREVHYELTALVREELDRRAGVVRRALTDDEWLARSQLTTEVAQELGELFGSARSLKYGGAKATAWAVRDNLARAQRALEAADGSPRSAA